MPNREFFLTDHPSIAIERGIEQLKGLLTGYNGYASRTFDHDVQADENNTYIVIAYRVAKYENLYWNKTALKYEFVHALEDEARHRKVTIIDRRP